MVLKARYSDLSEGFLLLKTERGFVLDGFSVV